ncbi:hypothetical protein CD32_01705 [Lysinibacillus odysseyi 34hs-1 = NBRC 100172]|uniref:Phage protein n=2 Tax=Lysinibacillus odysseyi TaxID=202611 RepID=A0A0A3JN12_9BACI|nr:hypothetical protein CD32_01705 [Lysinibacillus odysseyi 34hs-1 = NBRC 100172]
MQEQIDGIITALESFGLEVYEDELSEDEEAAYKKGQYHFFVYDTGDMQLTNDFKSINQEVAVYYYSEKRDDLDERTVDIILALKNVPMFTLQNTFKDRLKRKDTDNYVDRITLVYNRRIVVGQI